LRCRGLTVLHATEFGNEVAKIEQFGLQLVLDRDEGRVVDVGARFGQLGLEVDNVFTKIEVLGEQA
jgi:hypothetical protein